MALLSNIFIAATFHRLWLTRSKRRTRELPEHTNEQLAGERALRSKCESTGDDPFDPAEASSSEHSDKSLIDCGLPADNVIPKRLSAYRLISEVEIP